MQHHKKRVTVLGAGLAVLALATGGLKAWAEQGEEKEAKVALSSEQIIASIHTAVAAKLGGVLEVEVETEGGKAICQVKMRAADGKTYEVEVDVASNKVIEVEEDDDEDEQDKD